MATMKPKKTKIEDTVVGAYQKIEDTLSKKMCKFYSHNQFSSTNAFALII